MTILKATIAAVSLLAANAPAFAENWMEFRTPDGALSAIDKDSVVVSGTHVKFKDRTVYPAQRLIGIYDSKPMKTENVNGAAYYVAMRGTREIDCATHKYSTSAVDYFNAAGIAVSKVVQDPVPAALEPDSIPAQEARLVCPVR